MNNFIIIVLDGVGVGELPDAEKYKDKGSNTLGNMAEKIGGMELPNLEKFGLGNIIDIKGITPQKSPRAAYGKMSEASLGKDSISGHWEIGGLKIGFDFPTYPDGFPKDMLDLFMKLTGMEGVLGNKAASGTEIIEELGDEHVATGYPIVYTSADSVFQIAAHEEIIPLEKLYDICMITRHKILVGNQTLGRVIARPFITENGKYKRTTNRKDYSVDPPEDTIMDILLDNGIDTIAIGKINDLFNYKGIKVSEITKSNSAGIEKIIEYAGNAKRSFIFANLVDFDVYYGHRNDPVGFHNALKEFDNRLPDILNAIDDTDVLILTADHGNDPTTPSTDHSREYVPLLFYRKNKAGKDLGVRDTFADIAQTAAHFFKINNSLKGKSFLEE